MSLFTIITILVVITAFFAYLNTRFLKLPETIGMMIISLIVFGIAYCFGFDFSGGL